jgi:hypothetical protein
MSRISLLILAICTILFMANLSYAITIKVPSDQPNIQAGIDAASVSDTVLVAPGTYTGDGNRDIDFSGKNVVLISESGPELTIINCEGTKEEPHRGLYFHSGEEPTAVVRGFTIANGIAPREGPIIVGWWWGGYGGAIKCDSGSSPTITDNIIYGNWASDGCGGAIFCDGGSSPTIEKNKVFGNWATYGGGVAVRNSSPIIKSNHIDSNSAYCNLILQSCDGGDGGGIYCINSAATITGNILTRNVARWGIYGGGQGFGAAIFCDSSCQLEIHNNTITANRWLDPGHGFSGGVVSLNGAEADLTQNIIAFNKGEGLGGIDISRVVISCCDIFGNSDGDWTGGAEVLIDSFGNLSMDPVFCDTSAGDYSLSSSSPCAPANNDCNMLIGSLTIGCEEYTGPVWHVSVNGNDELGDGSVQYPFGTIQKGINAAAEGDTVLVAPGIYIGDGSRDIDFGGKNLVVRSEGGPEVTVIDCQGSPTESHRGFCFNSGETADAVVKGFTITNAFVLMPPFPSTFQQAGAIICVHSDPTIEGNIITGNGGNGSEGNGLGGGIACIGSGAAILSNKITNNNAVGGGGIFIIGCSFIDGGCPLLKENLFQGNSAWGDANGGGFGGAVYCSNSSPAIIGNTIISNYSEAPTQFGGSALVFSISNPTLDNNIIAYNDGVAVSCENITITCTDIFGNSAGDWVGCIEALVGMDGNIAADPLFCDASQGDFHIYSASPCAPGNNECGELIGALGIGCSSIRSVFLDIKPGSCPNPLNAKNQSGHGKAVLPVAILGTYDFDVHEIDPESITLNGVAPVRLSYEDVGTPADKTEDSCACTEDGPDGFEDLTLKFDRKEIVSTLTSFSTNIQGSTGALAMGSSSPSEKASTNVDQTGHPSRDDYVLHIEGQLNDGSLFNGYDCVVLMTKGDVTAKAMEEASRELELIGNHPNPFNPVTRISFYLPDAMHVKIDIYNILGQRIESLVDGIMESGDHVVEWDGSDASSGVYFYRFKVGDYIESRKMLLLK